MLRNDQKKETHSRVSFLLGNTAQSWRCRYAVRFFVRLYENDAAGLTPSKEFSCKMTENLQVDALPSRQAGFVRCCLYFLLGGGSAEVRCCGFALRSVRRKSSFWRVSFTSLSI